MDPRDIRLVQELEAGLPLVDHPFAEIALRLGMSETEVLDRIAWLKRSGIIRRMRARINQRSVGIVANALVAWKVSGPDADRAGALLAMMPGVTHCYRRSPVPGRWEYLVYTVHHGWSEDEVRDEIRMIAEKAGYPEYIVMFSTREYKRTPHTRVDEMVRME